MFDRLKRSNVNNTYLPKLFSCYKKARNYGTIDKLKHITNIAHHFNNSNKNFLSMASSYGGNIYPFLDIDSVENLEIFKQRVVVPYGIIESSTDKFWVFLPPLKRKEFKIKYLTNYLGIDPAYLTILKEQKLMIIRAQFKVDRLPIMPKIIQPATFDERVIVTFMDSIINYYNGNYKILLNLWLNSTTAELKTEYENLGKPLIVETLSEKKENDLAEKIII